MAMTVSTENQKPGADDADRLAKDYGAPIPYKKTGPWPLRFWRSAVGKKWVMAVTGIMLLGFVLGHMLGNLKLYLGPSHLNDYAEWLHTVGEPALPKNAFLWIMRSALLVAVALHITAAAQLTIMNRRARPVRYKSHRDYIAANFASRTMRWTGIIVLLFLFWHLADLTFGWANPDYVKLNVYNNVVYSLERWPVALLYIVANIALAFHIFHGAWSMFQSLGLNNPRWNAARKGFAAAFAAVILIGNVSFPIAVLAGVVSIPS
jgi:succinate dehydrogenase / fumarate reductase cytochrome b subunit